MKHTAIRFSLFALVLTIVSFTLPKGKCDKIPELNKEVIHFVKAKMGKKVGRGECWDLAAEALNKVEATWDGNYKYGKEVFVKSDCIFPGDIIQLEGVLIKYEKSGMPFKEKMSHHTAVIFEVPEKGVFVLAHQNTATSGKKVGLSDLDVKNITKGKYMIYRPVK